ncbi:MAG: hypothetical protein CVV27_14755 [Candidatus Melainabacteria bacterium HGW-Melainabacteria-1]|nr:MAG: hypothetical protein CVV27_14755 [Candidatus Melainabacteria bacterium HGW-Melainabacteria-1]
MARLLPVLLGMLLCLSLPGLSQPSDPIEVYAPGVSFAPEPELLSPIYLEQRVQVWLASQVQPSAADLATWIQELYLQAGFPGVGVEVTQAADGWLISIREAQPEQAKVRRLLISGGTPQERYLTRHNLHQREGQPLDRDQLLADIAWLEHNHFLPLQLRLEQVETAEVDVDLHIVSGAEYIPTGNLALNDVVGLAVTAGLIVNNPFNSGQIVRAMGKRNNIPFPGGQALGLVQDWEYTLSWATTVMPIEGMSLGLNHYNKVDYFYPDYGEQGLDLISIRSLGVDLYSGFPIWSDPASRRYLRGVFNLSLIEDRFKVDPLPDGIFAVPSPAPSPETNTPESLTKSGNVADLLLMPSLTISYSDIDDYRLPRNGSFLQARLGGSVLDARFIQATLTGTSFWTPYSDDKQQWTVLLRSAAGSTFGANPPFYRGFLNTGNWLVRGATQFSITEKHSLRFSEELHYIYKPTALEVDNLLQQLIGQTSGGIFDGWALDLNVFLDQGAYWRDELAPRSGQLSVGGGINLITPFGSILGVDLATPLYPSPGGFSALLRISAPLSFTLYSDWGNTNGFFLR